MYTYCCRERASAAAVRNPRPYLSPSHLYRTHHRHRRHPRVCRGLLSRPPRSPGGRWRPRLGRISTIYEKDNPVEWYIKKSAEFNVVAGFSIETTEIGDESI